ncbi:MAG: hypothetical protein R2940_17640 [Syntrophotaleaceae bacterium]
MRGHLVCDGEAHGGGDAVPREVAAQTAVLLGSRSQVGRGFFQLLLLERQETGKVRAVGQADGFLEVFEGLVFVAKDQLPAPIHQGLLVVRRDKPLEETQRQPVFRADRWDGWS